MQISVCHSSWTSDRRPSAQFSSLGYPREWAHRKKSESSFWKTKPMLSSLDRSSFYPGSRSRRMAYEDSVQIAASGLERLPAPARMRRGETASDRETMGRVAASGRGGTPITRTTASASRPTGKFSALQSFENSQNAEEISILRGPVSPAGGPHAASRKARRASGAGGPRRSGDRRRHKSTSRSCSRAAVTEETAEPIVNRDVSPKSRRESPTARGNFAESHGTEVRLTTILA